MKTIYYEEDRGSINALDSHGQVVPDWRRKYKLQADIETLFGAELTAARKKHSQVSHRIKTRYRRGIKSTGRFAFGDRKLEIVSVNNVNFENRDLVIDVIEVK